MNNTNTNATVKRFKSVMRQDIDAMVLALRSEGYYAYAETERDTEGQIASEYVVTSASLGTVLFIAGHGQSFTD